MKPICNICNKEMKSNVSLSHHIMKFHKLSAKYYYDRYLKKQGEGICECGYPTSFKTIPTGYNLFCSRICSNRSLKTKRKIKQTCLENYGVDSPYKCNHIREKGISTCLKNYGVVNPSKSKQIRTKTKSTCLIRYSTECSLQSENVKRKSENTCFKNYGTRIWPKSDIFRKQSRIKRIKEIEKQKFHNEPMFPTIGIQERQFLDELQKHSQYKIIRNDSSFRYIVGRFPDGHIPEVKLFIQFDEYHHFSDKECIQYREEDIQCTKDLESISGYRVFRISQKDWENNKQQIISKFLSYLPKEV